jgi:hypothetical protein
MSYLRLVSYFLIGNRDSASQRKQRRLSDFATDPSVTTVASACAIGKARICLPYFLKGLHFLILPGDLSSTLHCGLGRLVF